MGARDEDLGPIGDVTSELCVPSASRAEAALIAGEHFITAGLAAVEDLLDVFAPTAVFRPSIADGRPVEAGTVLGRLMGPTREILAAERTLLNLVGRLSGIATLTAEYVKAAGPKAGVFDTRKTTPGLRVLEKYAVRCGGGMVHRLGLHDAVLIKDNHLAGVALGDLARVVGEAARAAWGLRARPGLRFVEVEVDSIDQLKRVLTVEQGSIEVVLLDNMTIEGLREAVAVREEFKAEIFLEASGGVTLQTIGAIADTGIDRISVGAITHHAAWADVRLDITGTLR